MVVRVINRGQRRTSEYQALMKFVRARAKYAAVVNVFLYDDPKLQRMCEGHAFRQDPFFYKGAESSLVTIGIPLKTEERFPYKHAHVPGLEVTYADWQEEFVVVLAHELRHIEQFWTWKEEDISDTMYTEVDAELFGVTVLRQFREARTSGKLFAPAFDPPRQLSIPEAA